MGVVPKSSGPWVSQKWALLSTNCGTLDKELPFLEPQFLICKMGTVIGSVLQGWEEVMKVM